jgi:hypothetical protein
LHARIEQTRGKFPEPRSFAADNANAKVNWATERLRTGK